MRTNEEKIEGLVKLRDAVKGTQFVDSDLMHVALIDAPHIQVVYEVGGYDLWDMSKGPDGSLEWPDMTLKQAAVVLIRRRGAAALGES